MQLQYSQGTKKIKDEYIYPSSPTLINSLDIPKNLKQDYINKRNQLLAKKKDNTIQDPRLRPYQNQDVNFLMQLKQGKGVFNEQRTGKTPTTLITMRNLNQNRCIIFVPKSGILKWIQEYRIWHGGPVYTVLSSWNQKKRIHAYETFQGTLIINHDKAAVDYDYIFTYFKNADAIVLDEAHILRTHTNSHKKANVENYNSSKVSIALIRLRQICKDAYALTGTPTGNYTHEIFGILKFLFPTIFPSYYPAVGYYFKIHQENIGQPVPIRRVGTFQSLEKEKELLEFIETFSIQRKRRDVMQWLPKTDIEEIFLEPTTNQIRWMDELKRYFETDNIICENALTVMTALRQLTISPLRYELKELGPKLDYVIQTIEDFPNKPIIIVSCFTSILRILKDVLSKTHKVELLEGQTSAEKRYSIEQDFQKGKFNILLGNIRVVNVNLTLSRAEQIIFLDQSLIHIENEQTEDRFVPTTKEEAERKEGQLVTKLFISDSIDTYIRQSLLEKKNETEIVNDYVRSLNREDRK